MECMLHVAHLVLTKVNTVSVRGVGAQAHFSLGELPYLKNENSGLFNFFFLSFLSRHDAIVREKVKCTALGVIDLANRIYSSPLHFSSERFYAEWKIMILKGFDSDFRFKCKLGLHT